MIKTILWDFDGVIFNSMKIKADGFIELFKEYDSHYVKAIEEYHYLNGGISRFEKIQYFYTQILKQNITEDMTIQLADKFSQLIEKKLYNKSNLIQETNDFIKMNFNKYNFHIVSGAEHNELNSLCDHFKLTQYFKTIDGSPTKKDKLIQLNMDRFQYKENETILIGDSLNDYSAAQNNNIKFFGYNNIVLKDLNYISTFKNLKLEP